jgi:hypothetical protein
MIYLKIRTYLMIGLLAVSSTAFAQVEIWQEGSVDCGTWASARKANNAVALEHYLTGMVNGIAFGTRKELWRNNPNAKVNRAQLYLWMDGWCAKNPLKDAASGIFEFVEELNSNVWK